MLPGGAASQPAAASLGSRPKRRPSSSTSSSATREAVPSPASPVTTSRSSKAASRQTITVFEGPAARVVDGRRRTAGAAAAASAAAPASAATPPRVVALVFEQLRPGGARSRGQGGPPARRVPRARATSPASSPSIARFIPSPPTRRPRPPVRRRHRRRAASTPGLPLRRAGVVPGAEFASGASRPADAGDPRRGQANARHGHPRRPVADHPRARVCCRGGRWSCCSPKGSRSTPPRKSTPDCPCRWAPAARRQLAHRRALRTLPAADRGGQRGAGRLLHLRRGRTADRESVLQASASAGRRTSACWRSPRAPAARSSRTPTTWRPGRIRAADDQASYYVLGLHAVEAAGRRVSRRCGCATRCESCTVLARRGYRASSPSRSPDRRPRRRAIPGPRWGRHADRSADDGSTPTTARRGLAARDLDYRVIAGGCRDAGRSGHFPRAGDGRARPSRRPSSASISSCAARPGPTRASLFQRGRSRFRPVRPESELVVYDHASRRASVVRRAIP